MFPYWLLFTLWAVGAVQYRPEPSRVVQGGPLLVAVAFLMLLMIGLRYEVGGDWGSYENIFQEISYMDFSGVLELADPGYALLNWIANAVGAEIWLVNLVCAAIFTWGLTSFARLQPNPWLALAVAIPYLVIVVAMGYTRQGVAIGLLLLGFARMRQNQSIWKFAGYAVLAALFHKTAIVILPLVALAVTKNRVLTVGSAMLLGLVLYNLVMSAQIERLTIAYIENQFDSEGATIRVLMNLVPALLFLIFPSRFGFSSFEAKLWRNFSIAAFAALALLFTLESSTVVDRLALYLIPLQIAVLSRLPYKVATQADGRSVVQVRPELIFAVIGYSAVIQFVWLTAASHADAWLPYQIYPLT